MLAEVWQIGGGTGPRKPNPTRRMSSQGEHLLRKEREKPKYVSFSTGPQSIPTHWKQTLFLLREPIVAQEGAELSRMFEVLILMFCAGTVVQGVFKCKKSDGNSRELDVEIHYSARHPEATDIPDVIVQTFKVR